MSTYFTSDHHFGHAGALGLYRRPFASVAEMDRQMIDWWNSVVGPQDEVWHLGDFAIRQRPERAVSLLTLRAEINEDVWATLNSDTSRPIEKPKSGRIAVKVINHVGDEVMKVFRA
jgi:calcineurin-like phosphoesterase family protein